MKLDTRKLILAGSGAAIGLFHPARLARFLPAHTNQTESINKTLSSKTPTAPPIVNAAAFKRQGRLAFVQDGLLYVLDGDTGMVRQLTTDGIASRPAWSHDGEWLAFMYNANPKDTSGSLWLERRDGTEAHQAPVSTAFDSQFSWSPAGDVLNVSGRNGIWLVPVTGAGRHLSEVAGLLSPDGKTLAYGATLPQDSNQPENRRDALFIRAVSDKSQPVRLLVAPPLNGILLAGWWPNGQGLLYRLDPDYSASIVADGLALMSIPITGGGPQQLAVGLVYPEWLSLSPQGDLLMVAGSGREVWTNKSLVVVRVASGNVRNLQNPRGCVAIGPSISADDRRIAFVAARDCGKDDPEQGGLSAWVASRTLWVENADGSGAHSLPSAGQGIYQPLWSKDGSHILYVKDNSLWLIGADGGEPARICGPIAADDPTAGTFGYYGFISYGNQMVWFRP
jgi:TolB protein